MSSNKDPKTYSILEFAKAMNVTEGTVRSWISRGKLPQIIKSEMGFWRIPKDTPRPTQERKAWIPKEAKDKMEASLQELRERYDSLQLRWAGLMGKHNSLQEEFDKLKKEMEIRTHERDWANRRLHEALTAGGLTPQKEESLCQTIVSSSIPSTESIPPSLSVSGADNPQEN